MDRTMTIKNKRLSTNNLKLSKMFDSKTFIFMIIGFLLSRSILIDGIAPLGLAFFLYICKLDKYKVPVFLSVLVGTLLSFIISNNMNKLVSGEFYLPTKSIIISTLGVFIIVLITMFYSVKKIKHENILEAIREENI